MESISKNFICFLIIFFLCLNCILCQINDNYEKHYLENGTYDLLDVNDYHNLKLIVSTSKKIYIGIPPSYKTTTEAELINSTSLITLNENYLLAACLNNSLLTRISLTDGTSTNILDYSDIDNSLSLKIPSTTCSLSKLENLIFIGYSEAQYYEVINGNDTEIFGNKTNIVIKINIENIDSEPNIIEKVYFTFPISTTLTGSIREISCVPIKIINDENNYRLVCVYETLEYAADYNTNRYYVYSTIINENFDNFEHKMNDVRIYRTNDFSGFRIYKIDDYNAICLSKKTARDIHLEYVEGILTIISIESSKNLSTISSSPDLFDYNNNFVFYAEDKNPYYFRLNKKSSANYFMLYDYYEKKGLSTIKKLIGYYDEINDYILVVFQNNHTNYIKYFTLQNNANIYNIGAYTGIHRIKTNETAEYDLYNLLDFSQFGNVQINKITTYKSNDHSSKTYAKDNIYLSKEENKVIVTADLSLNYWFDYTFLLIEEVKNDYKKYFYLSDVTLSIRTCAYQCGSCYEDYYKCDECRNENFIILNSAENENICYPINQLLKGHIYNSATNTFQECYSSCDFCTERSEDNEDHKCEECAKNYYPSYNNLGNCYQLTDSIFLTESCPKYRINSTGECINECPTSTPYYLFQYNYINLTEQTTENLEQIYTKTSIKPPKYLFNNICYDSCPLYSLPDDDNNICVCEFGYHIDSETSETICHPGLYCVSSNDNYRYFLEDAKECITEGCPTDYYQFNFRCYKDGCPDNTIASDTDSHKCISSFSYCYINEFFENICSEEQSEEYLYNFDETLQYLKNCEESEIYTTQSSKTYLFNGICYITCPGNTKINTEQNECICINFGYYPTNGNIICYGENEKCGDGKIPVIDNKKCLNSIEECYAFNYKSFNNECFSLNCPSNSEIDSSTGKTCICIYLFYNDINQNILNCFDESITECPSETYEFFNSETKECFISIEDCFNKGNNYFFNKYCYKIGCPSDKILLYDQNIQIQNYYKTNLLLSNDELIDRLCICDINNGVWINYTSDNQLYYQECLTQCPTGYLAESTTNQCLRIIPTTVITTLQETQTTIITSQPITTEPITTIITTLLISTIITTQPITTLPKILTTEPITTVLKEKNEIEIVIPDEYYNDKENCKVIYNNKCYLQCPDGTCLTQNDPLLITCVEKTSKTKIFNDICFENFDDITKNIKSMSENDNIISTESGIIIRGYSTNSDSDINSEAKYSLVDLGDCEEKIRKYYSLDEDTELFILGIDSPNKDSTASTSVYNYGIYLENGTLLDHSEACKDTKISVSSVITNTDLVKLDEASYFNDLGYDIYNESSSFYTDNCAPASVDGNDITLSDRKKDFYPSNVSLCNDSCHYANVDLETKRFTCECDTGYNFSNINQDEEEIEDIEDNSNYFDYFLSLINYKIAICYELFYDFESYYYNAGFYIAVGTLILCLCGMFSFLSAGMRAMNKLIKENIPSKNKLKDAIKERNEKVKEYLEIDEGKNNPIKKYSKKLLIDSKSKNEKILKTQSKFNKNGKIVKKNNKNNLKTEGECIKGKKLKKLDSIKSVKKKKVIKNLKSDKNIISITNTLNLFNIKKDKKNLKSSKNIFKKTNFSSETEEKQILRTKNNKILSKNQLLLSTNTKFKNNKRKVVKDEYGLISYISDDQVDVKELNIIPYTQALRVDKRNYIQMFLSVLAHEIEIVDIFYYKSPYNHFSLVLSIYIFELCLDLTLNCLLYTDDVVSEKYNNNGSIAFFTSLSLSFMSNIFANIIAFIVGKLAGYEGVLEMIIKNVIKQKEYYINIIKFKKYLTLKLTGFFIVQFVINLCMCYYLMIFCTIYHNTQGSILVNYIVGIAESMIISMSLTIITSLLRYLSLKNKWKYIYYTSKYFFENF